MEKRGNSLHRLFWWSEDYCPQNSAASIHNRETPHTGSKCLGCKADTPALILISVEGTPFASLEECSAPRRAANAGSATLQGGSARNAIPREASAVVVVDYAREKELKGLISQFEAKRAWI